jgi:hypothetical protein
MRILPGVLLSGVLLCGGCASVGPSMISNGRAVYNEVINYTEDQQLLNLIVRERYDQTFGMLTVASVTASLKVSATAGAQFGIGPNSNFSGNLVPLSAGVAYEDSPTISYTPLGGEAFLSRMLTPITVMQGFLLLNAADDAAIWMRQLCRSINGLENPVGMPPSPQLERFIHLLSKLRRAGVVVLGGKAAPEGTEPEYYIRLSGYRDAHADDVRDILGVLGIRGVIAEGQDITLPIRMTVEGDTSGAINLQTRSAYDVIKSAASMIEVPAAHRESGIVAALEWAERDEHRFMTIRSSQDAPENAVIAVPFRGWWYYIDATDTRSKRSFKVLRLLVGLRLAEKTADQKVPLLMVPVR